MRDTKTCKIYKIRSLLTRQYSTRVGSHVGFVSLSVIGLGNCLRKFRNRTGLLQLLWEMRREKAS